MFKKYLPKSFRHALVFSQLFAGALLITAVSSCACTDSRKLKTGGRNSEIAEAGVIESRKAAKAIALIKPIKDSKVQGQVAFTKVADGVKIVADIDGLTPGKHGFHVHEFGDCGGDGSAAGAHFNPTNQKHGGPDSPERHVGDLGNLVADEKGHAHYERVDTIIALEGEHSIIGRSIIIHADPDDFTSQPAGNSGAKIACGKIESVKE